MPKFQDREVLHTPKFGITLKGRNVGEDMLKYVESVLVEDEDNMIPMASITINDENRDWMNDIGVVKGTTVTIAIGHIANYKRVFNGSITYVEATFPQEGYPQLAITCTDIANGMTKSEKAKSWKKRKISDIITLLHKEKKVKVVVEDTKVVLDHITKEEGSSLDFVLYWKEKLGAKYYKINDDTYYFGTKPRNVKATQTLGYMTGGHEIFSFNPVYQEIQKEEIEETEIDEEGKKNTVKVKIQPTYEGLRDTPLGKAKPKAKS